jgi:hypothetical protein
MYIIATGFKINLEWDFIGIMATIELCLFDLLLLLFLIG